MRDPGGDTEQGDVPDHDELQRHFHQLAELPLDDRRASLEVLRGRRPSLAAHLEPLLEHAVDSDEDDPWIAVGRNVRRIVEDSETERDEEALAQFGGYRLLKVLGRGGMGTVYEAEQQSPRRRVALKVLPAALITQTTLRRFEHETEALARLQHPCIAPIYDAGFQSSGELLEPAHEGARGQPFFAMELVDGRPLSTYASEVKLQQRLRVFVKVCEAIHYAHTQGVIHRDLKPANILVDGRGQPRIVDFGVARIVDEDRTTIGTRHGQLIGTLSYMSPEQAMGDPSDVGPQSDVFSLGVILYEIVTGERPRHLDNRSLPDAIRMVRDEDIPAIGRYSDTLVNTDLEVVVAKGTERDPNRRYQSALELGRDVLRVLRDQPIDARSPSTLYQLRRYARRNRLLILGIATTLFGISLGLAGVLIAGTSVGASATGLGVGALLGTVGLAIGIVAARRALVDLAIQRDLAASASAAARMEAERAESMQEILSSLFLSGLPERARGRDVTVREAVDVAATALEERFSEATDALGWANDLVGTCYLALGDVTRAELHLRRALRTRRLVLGSNHENTFDTTRRLATLLCDTGRPGEAVTLARSAVESFAGEDGGQESLEATRLLARALTMQGDIVEAHCLLEQAAKLGEADTETDDAAEASTIAVRADLGRLELRRGRMDQAEAILRSAFRDCEELLGEDHPQSLRVRTQLAETLQARGQFEEASELLNHGLALHERVLGPEHPETLATLETLAEVYRKSDRTYLASFLLERLVDTRTRMFGRNNASTLRATLQLGSALLHQGKTEAAVSQYLGSLRAAEFLSPLGSFEEVAALSNLGFASERLGRRAEAVTWFERAVRVASKVLPPGDQRLSVIRANHAMSLVGVGELERSEQLLRRCYDELEARNDDSSQSVIPQHFRRPVADVREFFEVWGAGSFDDA